jgi:hypothetical protein
MIYRQFLHPSDKKTISTGKKERERERENHKPIGVVFYFMARFEIETPINHIPTPTHCHFKYFAKYAIVIFENNCIMGKIITIVSGVQP